MGVPFTIVQGVILLTDKFGNIVGTKQIAGEKDEGGVDDLKRLATSTVLMGRKSSANSTIVPLAANGVFTGSAWESTLHVANISILVNASHASAALGLKIQWSTNGSDVDLEDSVSVAAGGVGLGDPRTFGIKAEFFRIVYTNGATLQTFFRLATTLQYVPNKSDSRRIGNTGIPDDVFHHNKSIVAGVTPTNIFVNMLVDETGAQIVNTIAGFNAAFSQGYRATAALTRVDVRATTFVEQTTNAQRSISSANANDTGAGTGARTVRITYYTATFTGPFTVDLTLSGVAAVNTGVADICYVEKIQVLTAGSGGVNAGIITLFGSTGGGGGAIGTIAAGDNQTFWTHHYVPAGKTCVITGFIGSHSNTVVGGGAMFTLRAKDFALANSAERQVSDFLRVYGQASSSPRNYLSPIKVIGPARVLAYVQPETATASVYRAAFDFFEQTT